MDADSLHKSSWAEAVETSLDADTQGTFRGKSAAHQESSNAAVGQIRRTVLRRPSSARPGHVLSLPPAPRDITVCLQQRQGILVDEPMEDEADSSATAPSSSSSAIQGDHAGRNDPRQPGQEHAGWNDLQQTQGRWNSPVRQQQQQQTFAEAVRTLTIHNHSAVPAVMACKFDEAKNPLVCTVMSPLQYFRIAITGPQWPSMLLTGIQQLHAQSLHVVGRAAMRCFEPLLVESGLSKTVTVHLLLADEDATGGGPRQRVYNNNYEDGTAARKRRRRNVPCPSCRKSSCDFQRAREALGRLYANSQAEDLYHFHYC